MSEPEKTNPDAEEVVKGGLFAALGGFEGNTSSPEIDQSSEPVKAPEKPEATDVSKEAEKPATEATDASVKLSAKDLRVKRKEPAKAKPEPVKEAPREKPEPTQEKKEEPKEKPDYSQFANRERETLELLEFGESKELADKGLTQKVAKYYEDRSRLINELQEDNFEEEGYDPQQDPKYRAWARQNKPPVDVDKLEAIRQEKLISTAEERALARLKKEQEAKDAEFRKYIEEQEREKLRPEIEREVAKFSDDLLASLDPEVTKAYAEKKDWKAVEEEMPIEAPVVRQVLNEYADKAEVLEGLASGVIKPTTADATQNAIRSFIAAQSKNYLKKIAAGEVKGIREGKPFGDPSSKDFNPETQWTFSKQDIIKMLSKEAQIVAKNRIAAEKKKFESLLKRQAPPSMVQKETDTEETSGTGVRPSSAGTDAGGAKLKRRSLMDIL